MAMDLIGQGASVLWIIHRVDLRRQALTTLRDAMEGARGSRTARTDVVSLRPGKKRVAKAAFTVASIQTLLKSSALDGRVFDYVVVDECTHYRADHWNQVNEKHCGGAKVVGLTAYPERSDGRSLWRMFGAMVVAANYTELVRDGHLVRCRVWRPERPTGSDLATNPVRAWIAYAEGSKTFAFVHSIEAANNLAAAFRAAGVEALSVSAGDDEVRRRETFERYRDPNGVRILVSVDALTEGIDEPQTRCVLLARPFRFEGSFVQAVGRMLRPCEGKRDAILIDLVGATAKHGLPTDDRIYSLGDANEEDRGAGGGGEGPSRGDRSERREPEVLRERLFLVDRGDLAAGEETVPFEPGPPILDRAAEPKPMPRVTRATAKASVMRNVASGRGAP